MIKWTFYWITYRYLCLELLSVLSENSRQNPTGQVVVLYIYTWKLYLILSKNKGDTWLWWYVLFVKGVYLTSASRGVGLLRLFEMMDFRVMVKSYLDKSGNTCPRFKNNLPAPHFCSSFMTHNPALTSRTANNMKRARATVSPEELDSFFSNLNVTFENVPPQNIFN